MINNSIPLLSYCSSTKLKFSLPLPLSLSRWGRSWVDFGIKNMNGKEIIFNWNSSIETNVSAFKKIDS